MTRGEAEHGKRSAKREVGEVWLTGHAPDDAEWRRAVARMLREDLAVLDPTPAASPERSVPWGAAWVGKRAKAVLGTHAQRVFRARYDGTVATTVALGVELGIPRYQVIRWAEELGCRNQTQPTKRGGDQVLVRDLAPAWPWAEMETGEDLSDEERTREIGDGEGEEELMDMLAEMAALTGAVTAKGEEEEGDSGGERNGSHLGSRAMPPGMRPCERCGQPTPAGKGHRRLCHACRHSAAPTDHATPASPAPTARPVPPADTEASIESDTDYAARFRALAVASTSAVTSHRVPDTSPAAAAPSSRRMLYELLERLPAEDQWTVAKRDIWLDAFTAVLDLLIALEPSA